MVAAVRQPLTMPCYGQWTIDYGPFTKFKFIQYFYQTTDHSQLTGMGRFISLVILIIDIIVIIDIVKSHKDTEKKVLWIIAVVFLPVLGPLLYYIVGKRNP
jgi:hypothetical protein